MTDDDESAPTSAAKFQKVVREPHRSILGKMDRHQRDAATEKQGFYEEKGAFRHQSNMRDLTDADIGQNMNMPVVQMASPVGLNMEEKYSEMLIHLSKYPLIFS